MPSGWSSRARSTCAGSSCGFPSRTARCCAAEMASWARVVTSMVVPYVCQRGGRRGGRQTTMAPARCSASSLAIRRSQPVDLVLEGEDTLDALEVDALVGQPLHLTQDLDVPRGVQPLSRARPPGRDEPEPVVLPEGLRVQAADLRRPLR